MTKVLALGVAAGLLCATPLHAAEDDDKVPGSFANPFADALHQSVSAYRAIADIHDARSHIGL